MWYLAIDSDPEVLTQSPRQADACQLPMCIHQRHPRDQFARNQLHLRAPRHRSSRQGHSILGQLTQYRNLVQRVNRPVSALDQGRSGTQNEEPQPRRPFVCCNWLALQTLLVIHGELPANRRPLLGLAARYSCQAGKQPQIVLLREADSAVATILNETKVC